MKVAGVAEVAPASDYISLSLDNALAEEEYTLSVSNEAVKIVAGGSGGYGVVGMDCLYNACTFSI